MDQKLNNMNENIDNGIELIPGCAMVLLVILIIVIAWSVL
jgi:hypothetical protein